MSSTVTTAPAAEPDAGSASPRRDPSRADEEVAVPIGLDRWGGAAGLAFALSLVIQNALRGAFLPTGEVTAADVLEFVVDHRAVVQILDVLVAVNAVCLLLFVATVHRRTAGGRGATWANVGLLGAAGILALFLLTVAVEATLAARGAALDPATVDTLWALHNAVFAVVLLAVGLALLGFSLASVEVGLVPASFRVIGPLGAGLMVVTSAAAVPLAEGSAVLFVGLLGFLGWIAFLVVAGWRLIRSAA